MFDWKRIRVTVATGEPEIDAAGVFEAYTDGHTWNGWQTPYFTREEGLRVSSWSDLLRSKSHDPESIETVRWDDAAHAFVVSSEAWPEGESLPDDVVKGRRIEELGETVYPIGAYRWTWELA